MSKNSWKNVGWRLITPLSTAGSSNIAPSLRKRFTAGSGRSGSAGAWTRPCAASAVWRSVAVSYQNCWEILYAPDLAIPARDRRLRKEVVTAACREKPCGRRSYRADRRQRKVCRVKALLPEPQSSWVHPYRRRKIAATPYWRVIGLYVSIRSPNLSSMPFVKGIKGTNGAPTHTESLP
jgi:hypothetical protein